MAGSVITAGTTRTQAGATQITSDFTTVNTSTAATAGTNVGDGVLLPQIGSGSDRIQLLNNTANPIVVYGYGTDTVNGLASVAMPPYAAGIFIEVQPGAWQCILDGEPSAAFNSNTATASATLTAANVTGGSASVDLAMTGTLGAAGAATLPTVANLIASMWEPKIGATYRLRVINRSSANFAWTMTTNTGWTLTGTMSIAQNTWRDFVVTLTSLAAATLQAVGVGTDS